MSLLRAVDVPPPRVAPRERHVRVTALLVAALWFDVLLASARHARVGALPPLATAAAGLATQILFTALEALAARAAWHATGRALRWRELAPRLFAVSSAEAFAISVATGGTVLPSWLAQLLAGARAAPGPVPDTGLAFAFAAFGLLTVLRVVLSAHAQARLAGARWSHALGLVTALYLATRLAMWWTSDLMQGRSFQSWGTIP